MKIVIDIPEEIYDFVQNTSFVEDENTLFKQSNAERQKTLFLFDIIDAIRNGTPLPKEHGRLIDEQQIIDRFKPIEKFKNWYVGTDGLFNVLSDAPTIIEGSDSE